MVDLVSLIRKILSSSNGCKLIENGYRFVKLRKYLCFAHFLKQRKFFCSTERTFSPKQTQNAPKNSCTSDFCFREQKPQVVTSLLLAFYFIVRQNPQYAGDRAFVESVSIFQILVCGTKCLHRTRRRCRRIFPVCGCVLPAIASVSVRRHKMQLRQCRASGRYKRLFRRALFG